MVGSRTATAVVGLLVSVAVSAVVWVYLDSTLLFLFVPFVPYLLGGNTASLYTCPECGFSTRDPDYEHCPYDGTRLVERGTDSSKVADYA